MPTYEYECTSCGQHIEVFQRIAEDPLTTCGACGGRLRKVFHPAGIVFKGSGFYATDSRTSPKAEGAGAKKEPKKDAKKETGGDPSTPASSTTTTSSGSGATGSTPKDSSDS